MRKASARQALRVACIIVLVVLCAGMIAYSARLVRYPLDGARANELTITKLSLTHEVERTSDGKLTNPYAEPALAPVDASPKIVMAAVAAPKSQVMTELKAQPAPAKKIAPKKPAPKPAPAKPAPKKPARKTSKAKACPT